MSDLKKGSFSDGWGIEDFFGIDDGGNTYMLNIPDDWIDRSSQSRLRFAINGQRRCSILVYFVREEKREQQVFVAKT